MGKLRSFLDMPGHDYFKDCLVHIQDVSEDKPALWAVLLGALAYVNDWVNIRGSPNCKLVIRPELGPNKGYISLVRDQNAKWHRPWERAGDLVWQRVQPQCSQF